MDEKLHQKIAEAVHAEYGWKLEEVTVDEVERLRRGTCSFYTVRSTKRPLSYQPNFAVLRGSDVIGIGDQDAATKILDACSQGAPAEWWAEVITRFHQDVDGGIVLSNESVRPDVVRKLTAAGKAFAPPVLGEDGKSLSFLLLDPETYVVYSVTAKRSSSGEWEVIRTKVLGNPSDGARNGQQKSGNVQAKIEQVLR